MRSTHVLVSEDDLALLERILGREHPFSQRLRDAFDALNDPASAKYRAAAARRSCEGELEVDPGAVVSKGDDAGAYVMAWLWIGGGEANIKTGGGS